MAEIRGRLLATPWYQKRSRKCDL